MQLWLWFGIVVCIAIIGYFWIRTVQWQSRLIDFQGTYHKTMTPLQIRRSRRAFFESEIRKSAQLRRLDLVARIGWGVVIVAGILVAAQLLDVLDLTPHAQLWLALTWGVGTVAFGGRLWLERLVAQQLYELTALAENAVIIDLSATPRQLGQQILKNQLGLMIGTILMGTVLTIGSFQGRLMVVGTRRPITRSVWPVTGSNTAQQATAASSASQGKSSATTTTSQSEDTRYREPRVNRDPAYVRTLVPKSQSYITTQDQVGLLAMYYLAYIKAPADALEHNPGVKYNYHIINDRQPLTIVVKSNQAKRPFEFMAEIRGKGALANRQVRLYKFTATTPSALNGLVPAYREFSNSQVKMGQLINAYYSEEDGPYHRTMWAMEPGEAW
ncbi:hypothetical protein [Lactiplantibacillus xiangfangensis]|nr:hypothetical protein [Lactiplantibacillus xiangfangensis]